MPQIKIAPDHSSWAQMVAQFILEQGRYALDNFGRFTLALSGGSTPLPVYSALPELWRQHGLTWKHVHILWSDERCVPLGHPQSNYRMACEALIDKIEIPEGNVHPMRCGQDPDTSAEKYAATLRELLPDSPWPRIDLILLGMGTDGHTASLFPGTQALEESSLCVVANKVEALETIRLTMSIPVINAARKVAFLIAGADKASVLHSIHGGFPQSPPYPAQLINPAPGALFWLLDKDAAAHIKTLRS